MLKLDVFIVEDDELMVGLLKRMLIKMGHQVCGIAESFDDAVRQLQSSGASLIVSDMMLNGPLTGLDLGRHINQHFKFHLSTTPH